MSVPSWRVLFARAWNLFRPIRMCVADGCSLPLLPDEYGLCDDCRTLTIPGAQVVPIGAPIPVKSIPQTVHAWQVNPNVHTLWSGNEMFFATTSDTTKLASAIRTDLIKAGLIS